MEGIPRFRQTGDCGRPERLPFGGGVAVGMLPQTHGASHMQRPLSLSFVVECFPRLPGIRSCSDHGTFPRVHEAPADTVWLKRTCGVGSRLFCSGEETAATVGCVDGPDHCCGPDHKLH